MIFITGATGFLGQHLLPRLAAKTHVYALVRPDSKKKLRDLAKIPNVTWIEGDIESPGIVDQEEDRERLRADVTTVIHAAALYDLEAKYEALYWANIVGTHNIVHFARSLPKLAAFHHVSTMAVVGDFNGTFTETMFQEGQTFDDHYGATKFASEACVRQWEDVPRFIYRLGILVGDSKGGAIPKVDGPYYLMRAMMQNTRLRNVANGLRLVPLPFSENARVYLVPVDSAAEAIATAVDKGPALPPRPIRVYHVMGESGGLPIRAVLRKILDESGVSAKIVAVPRMQPVPWAARQLGVPATTLHYMYSRCRFEMRRLGKDFPEFTFPRFNEYADPVFRYARETLFASEGASAS